MHVLTRCVACKIIHFYPLNLQLNGGFSWIIILCPIVSLSHKRWSSWSRASGDVGSWCPGSGCAQLVLFLTGGPSLRRTSIGVGCITSQVDISGPGSWLLVVQTGGVVQKEKKELQADTEYWMSSEMFENSQKLITNQQSTWVFQQGMRGMALCCKLSGESSNYCGCLCTKQRFRFSSLLKVSAGCHYIWRLQHL